MDRFFGILCEGVHSSRGPSTSSPATASWRCSARRSPTRTMPSAPASRRCSCIDELAEYAAELRRDQGLNFLVRMGLNSGEVVVGGIGEDLGHGLHRARPHRRARAAHGAAGGARQGLPDRAHRRPGRGLLRACRSRRVRGQGRRAAAARPRADRGRRCARPPRRLPRSRLLALRRPRRRDEGPGKRLRAGDRGRGAGDRHRRRGRCRQEPALPRVRPALAGERRARLPHHRPRARAVGAADAGAAPDARATSTSPSRIPTSGRGSGSPASCCSSTRPWSRTCR